MDQENTSSTKAFYDKVATMPLLVHNPAPEPSAPFDPRKSEVVKWLTENLDHAEVFNQIFWKLRIAKAIIWDPTTNKWRGQNQGEYEKARADKIAARAAAREAKKNAVPPKPKLARGRKSRVAPEVAWAMVGYWRSKHPGTWPTMKDLIRMGANAEVMTSPMIDAKGELSTATVYKRVAWAKALPDGHDYKLFERPVMVDGREEKEIFQA